MAYLVLVPAISELIAADCRSISCCSGSSQPQADVGDGLVMVGLAGGRPAATRLGANHNHLQPANLARAGSHCSVQCIIIMIIAREALFSPSTMLQTCRFTGSLPELVHCQGALSRLDDARSQSAFTQDESRDWQPRRSCRKSPPVLGISNPLCSTVQHSTARYSAARHVSVPIDPTF